MLNLGLSSIPIQLLSGIIDVPICSKSVWEAVASFDKTESAAHKISGMLLSVPLKPYDEVLLVMAYGDALRKVRTEIGLDMPYYPSKKDKDDIKYTIYTSMDKLVADYANMSIYDVDRLPILDYWLLARDAYISTLAKTETGRKHLNKAYRLTQEDADEDINI